MLLRPARQQVQPECRPGPELGRPSPGPPVASGAQHFPALALPRKHASRRAGALPHILSESRVATTARLPCPGPAQVTLQAGPARLSARVRVGGPPCRRALAWRQRMRK